MAGDSTSTLQAHKLNRENVFSLAHVRACEFGLVRRVRQSLCCVSKLISTLRLNLMLTYGVPPEFRGGVLIFILTAIRRRVSPKFIGSRDCVPMAFTAGSR